MVPLAPEGLAQGRLEPVLDLVRDRADERHDQHVLAAGMQPQALLDQRVGLARARAAVDDDVRVLALDDLALLVGAVCHCVCLCQLC